MYSAFQVVFVKTVDFWYVVVCLYKTEASG